MMRVVAEDDASVAKALTRFTQLWSRKYPGGAPKVDDDDGDDGRET